ncbi:MAG: DNA polymerase I [Spirochaetaceae bacterium]|jgi:DNA polymerase-1|nr:DNA polymerase I [Spirochaetaceae bacterium]
MSTPLFLLDSYALIYRSYFAFISRPLRNSRGQNVSALFGFARIVSNLISDKRPKMVAAIFDSRTKTFRHEQYPEYKATRQKAPDDLHSQVPLVEAFLEHLGIPTLRVEGFEADDIIATLIQKYRGSGRDCYIVSGDKDLLQLVGDNVYELRPIKRPTGSGASFVSNSGGASNGEALQGNSSVQDEISDGTPDLAHKSIKSPLNGFEVIDEATVQQERGIPPYAILDYLSLTGDVSDNVPGVRGIGDKTAQKLILRFGNLDAVYDNIAGIDASTGKKLTAGRDSAYLSKKLITLRTDVPLPSVDMEALNINALRAQDAAAYLQELDIRVIAGELGRLGKELGAPEQTAKPAETTATQPAGTNTIQDTRPDISRTPLHSKEVFYHSADELPHTDAVYRVITDISEIEKLFERAEAQGFLAFDFETDSLETSSAQIVGFSIALKPYEAYYVPIVPHGVTREKAAYGETTDSPYITYEAVKPRLLRLFANPALTIVAHNAKFDYKISRANGAPRWKARIFDTMVAAWIIDPDFASFALEKLAYHYLNYRTAVGYMNIVAKNETFQSVPLDIACRYSAEDADICLRLKELFEGENYLIQYGSDLFYTKEMPLLPVLAEMEIEGIGIDRKELENYGRELGRELYSIQYDTWQIVGHEFNLSSPQQLQHVLFTERGLRPTKKTSTGWSTDMSVLEALAGEDELCRKILRHRSLSKLKSTYIDALSNLAASGVIDAAGRQGRIHTTFFQTGTATGRLSSRDPNLQNIPIREEEGRRIRTAFVAGEGRSLISADYNQIELVVLAHLSGDQELCASFNAGEDVHSRTAALIFGILPEEVSPARRRIAKTINFGVMYGMSAFRLAASLGIPRADAQHFISAYFKTYAGVKAFIGELIEGAEKNGYVTTMFGRRRAIRQINSANKVEKAAAERIAVNTPIQGSAADIVKQAMINLDAALTAQDNALFCGQDCAQNGGTKILLQVHDELILECPEGSAGATAALVGQIMEQAVPLSIPLRVNVETGKRWGEFH